MNELSYTLHIKFSKFSVCCTLTCTSQVSSAQLPHVASGIVFRLESRLVQERANKYLVTGCLSPGGEELSGRKHGGLLGLGSLTRTLGGGDIEADT